jgi:hypothetical protein
MAVVTSTEDEWQLYHQEKGDLMKPICLLGEFPDVWAEKGPPGLARNRAHIMLDLKPGALPIRQRQYPVPQEARLGIQSHLQWLKDSEMLIMSRAMEHPTVTHEEKGRNDYWTYPGHTGSQQCHYHAALSSCNSYTLLSLLLLQASWFTCLDLKDSFFFLYLTPVSQPPFIFEWEDPHTGRQTQMAWTRLPQRFKNSPTLFREALEGDLSTFLEENASCTLLQYEDDLLMSLRLGCHGNPNQGG